eukprot:1161066-Pelagomonas_calceolata.AAC.10
MGTNDGTGSHMLRKCPHADETPSRAAKLCRAVELLSRSCMSSSPCVKPCKAHKMSKLAHVSKSMCGAVLSLCTNTPPKHPKPPFCV